MAKLIRPHCACCEGSAYSLKGIYSVPSPATTTIWRLKRVERKDNTLFRWRNEVDRSELAHALFTWYQAIDAASRSREGAFGLYPRSIDVSRRSKPLLPHYR